MLLRRTCWLLRRSLAAIRFILRGVFALATVAFTAWFLISERHAFTTTPDIINIVEYDTYRAAAIQFIRDDAKLFVDAGILVLASLGSVVIVKKDDRIRREDVPEIVMFICATVLMCVFFYCNQRYGQELER
jgi:hypothetical protein